MRAALLVLVPACAWSARDEPTEVRSISPLVTCAGRTDALALGGIGDHVEGALTAEPRLTLAALALVPSAGLGGADVPAGGAIALVPADAGRFRPTRAPAPGIWTLTVDGASSVSVALVEAPALSSPSPPRFCRSEPVMIVSFAAAPLYREAGRPVGVVVAGTRYSASAAGCVAAELPGVERCSSLEVAVVTSAMPAEAPVSLVAPCPGAALLAEAVDGPTVVRMIPSAVPAGGTTRARVDEAVGDITEAAIRPAGSEQPFVVVASRPLASGPNAERVELDLPADLAPGNYDVRVRDEQCAAVGLAVLEVTP